MSTNGGIGTGPGGVSNAAEDEGNGHGVYGARGGPVDGRSSGSSSRHPSGMPTANSFEFAVRPPQQQRSMQFSPQQYYQYPHPSHPPPPPLPQPQEYQFHQYQYPQHYHQQSPHRSQHRHDRPQHAQQRTPSGPSREKYKSPHGQQQLQIQDQRRSNPPAPSSPSIPQASQSQHTQEHSLLLISLAESYFEAAYKIGASSVFSKTGNESAAYYKLMATGLACLESILLQQKGKAVQARIEAMVRLRYAALLFEETDNLREAEKVLLKGIITASRNNNLLDLTFSMQHLLIRIMFQMNPKASLIQLQKYTKDAEEREAPIWGYAFRFLRCSLLMHASQCQDVSVALHCLRSISNISHRRNDVPVFLLSNLMESLIHLYSGPEGIEPAQRALAKANSLQLEPDAPKLAPQLPFMKLVVDLVCAILLGRPNAELETKLKTLQAMLGTRENWASWSPVGDFEVAVHPPRQGRNTETLKFRWLPRDDIFIVGYFLSGIARFQSNTQEAQKAEKYLKEGLRRIDMGFEVNSPTPYSVQAAANRLEWRRQLRCYMLVYLTFLFAVRTEWDEALKSLEILNECLSKLASRTDHPKLHKLVLYLSGTIYQGTGDLEQALSLYSHLTPDAPQSEIGIMATLNTVLILRGGEQTDTRKADALLEGVEKACGESKNACIRAAFCAVKGTEKGELIKSKKFLATALQLAQQLANQQIIFLVLAFMCHRFFNGVVSEQAEKSARAAYVNARKGRDKMWGLLSAGMLEECLRRQGAEMEEDDMRVVADMREEVVRNLGRGEEGI